MKIAANLHLHIRPTALLIWLVSTGILVSLGLWQLSRANEKELILQNLNSQPSLELVDSNYLNNLTTQSFYPHQVKLRGRFEPQNLWVLDNQVNNHILGGNLIMPFVMEAQDFTTKLFIDFGWISYNAQRLPNQQDWQSWQAKFAQVQSQAQQVELTVFITPLQHNVFTSILVEQRDGWQFVGQISSQLIEKQAKTQVLPILGILDEKSPYALLVERPLINMPPEKHTAYAAQWFLLAIALNLIILIKAVSWKKQPIFS
ncbi:SURF1 family protein [Catenovulum agarivorans]|uniref:SURF1 family protein n=1 Tax=Catenovulum agarivorans TaxID=1172192 RepID=UPI0002DF19E0|nr:SURF1 family protein [Catenovulum agarivorans]